MLPIVLALHACLAAAADPGFPRELVDFVSYDGNPVFEGRGPGHWDHRIRERGWIMKEDGEYHLWYTGYEPGEGERMKLGYATSPDGIAWTRHPDNPIYDAHWVEDMMVVKHDGTYYMFAEGEGDVAHLLTSQDRVHWTRQGPIDIRTVNGAPLSPGPYGTPAALFDDGTWYLFYERDDEAIWLASSTDMKVWTNVRDEPVLERGPDPYDAAMVALNQVVKYQGRYYAYYHGLIPDSRPQEWTTNVAVSSDLVNWVKYPGNPILGDNQSSAVLVEDGDGFRLYTMHPAVHLHFPRNAAGGTASGEPTAFALPSTPWSPGGTAILGTYAFGDDLMEDLRASAAVGMNVLIAGKEAMDPETPEGAFCRDHGLRFMYHLSRHVYHGAKLREPITPDQTTIPLYYASGIPDQSSRLVLIDDELIRYEAITEEGLVNCERGADGTTPAAHIEGIILFWPEACAADIAEVKDSPNLFGYYVLDDSPGDALSALRGLYREVRKSDPDGRHPVCAGYGDAGSVANFGPGVCDLMLVYWYPVSTRTYHRESTAAEVQRILTTARRRVPGIPFAGVYQAFDGAPVQTGQGVPTPDQLREQLEDFVREGACGLVAFLSRGGGMPGWADLPELGRVVAEANREIRATGALRVRSETPAMAQNRLQPQGYWEHPRPTPGVVPAWRIVGPFEDTAGNLLDAPFPPDDTVDLDAVYPVKFGKGGWRVRESTAGNVGIAGLYGAHGGLHNVAVYAYCEVESPVEQAVQMRFGSDDDAWVRINGREVHRFDGTRGLDYDTDVVPVTLPAGKSTILVKVYNRQGMWGLFMRFTDTDGQPLEGLRFTPDPR